MIHLTNTLTGKKEELVVTNQLLLYVCGVTPYDDAHVGHGRCYVSFDVLNRVLRLSGIKVRYCRNFTDIDDKLLYRAQKEYDNRLRYHEIAQRYIDSFHRDMKALNCLSPDVEPRVTQSIPSIIVFIQKLIEKGIAYQSGNDVYYAIEKCPEYGKLSRQKIDDLHAGVRVDVREQKKNPLDFALWKGEPDGEFWYSPWGWGRPGWHIECSVMAHEYLGEHIDIHGGGLDLIFPHHENEIAQSESLFGAPFSRIWMHNGLVMSNKEKMSKSLGNFFVLHELFKKYDPMVVRYYFLTHHYKAPLDFSYEGLDAAQKAYERLIRVFSASRSPLEESSYHSDIVEQMYDFLRDDLNTPGMLGVVFDTIQEIAENAQELSAVKYIFVAVLGLTLEPLAEKKIEMTPEIHSLVNARHKARLEKNWALADQLRDQLQALGVCVRDEKI